MPGTMKEKSNMKKLILIDGNALIHRAFHALPPTLTSPKGLPTNAVFGFSSILIKTIKELKPDYIAATFDLAGPTFRHKEFKEYKIHRERAPQELYDQIPLVKKVVASFGIPIYEKQNYEADDLIGTITQSAKKEKDLQTIIATGDMDTLQLVDGKKVVVFTLRKGVNDIVTYDQDGVMTRYGLKPEQLNDYRGLKGDPSDNIPGVPGVGEKTAADLIQKFGSLEGLYKSLENKKKGTISEKLAEKLIANKDQAFFSKKLSTIVRDVDIDFSLEKADWRKNIDLAKVEKEFRDLGFASLVKRLSELPGLAVSGKAQDETEVATDKTVETGKQAGLFDLPADPNKENIYITDNSDENVKSTLANPGALVIGHDLKPFFKKLISQGKQIENKIFDIKIAAYLLNPDLKDYDFARTFYDQFGQTPSEDTASQPAYFYKLKNQLWDKLKSSNLIKVFEDIELPLIRVLAQMELNGIKIDTKMLVKLLKLTKQELDKLAHRIHKLAGSEFNINSSQQLGEILFQKLAIKGRIRKTGGGALSTAAPELEKIRQEHPIIDFILQYRELQKLKTTYMEPFPGFVDSSDGRVHTTYNQAGAGTGRLSSEDPNLQNIPIKTKLGQEFRKAFIAENGYQLVSFDYSQIELRSAAHIAHDKKMIEIFKRGEDIHTATAAEIFEVPLNQVTKEMRRQAKTLNFGILFGMGPLGFSRATGVTTQRAREFITKYFADFAGVARYMEEMKEKAHRDGYVETIFGRRRPIPDIYSSMPQVQAQAERMAINHPIQGTEADLMKLAMINVDSHIRSELQKDEVRLLLQVHDELVFEIKTELVEKLTPVFKKIMESVHKLDVPLVVDVKFGKNWQEMQDIQNN
jgi:DNA polymerase-1